MNRTLFKRVFPQVLAWAALAMFCGAVALAQETGAGTGAAAVRTDSQIEMDVVHALDASPTLQNDLITAATIQGEVTLSGTVSSESSQQLAGSIAAQVPGVTKVNNNLQVGNPQAAAEAGDQQAEENQTGNEAAAPGEEQQPAPGAGEEQQPAPGYPPGYPQDQSQAYPQQQPPYGQGQPPYGSGQPQAPAYETPHGPVTIPPGTLLQVRTSEPVSSKRAKDGEPVQFMVIQDIAVGGVLAIPRGAIVHGVVTNVKKAGALGGSPELALRLTSLDLGGRSYPLDSNFFKVKGPNKAGRTVGSALTGGLLGTMIGCAVGRGEGCAIGAGAGVAAGTATSAASPGPGIWIPAEALVDFHLKAPLTVMPVSAREAARLAEGLYQGGPNLYQRGYPPPYGQPYPYSPYGYPPVYYRPYYVTGGYYYWR